MASQRQLEANRRNSLLGGPNTEAGKKRSRLNRLTHGLTSAALVVLPEEDDAEYQQVLQGFRDTLQPQGAIEDALVLRLAQSHWRGLRSRRVETGMLGITADTQRGIARRTVAGCPDHLDPHKAIGAGFLLMPQHRWATWLRYDATISREFFRTLDTLERLQQTRQRMGSRSEAKTAAALSDFGIGFVSQDGRS